MLARCFFFNDTATTEIYTLSLHDALPISSAALTTTLASGSLTIGLLRCVTLFDSWPVSIRYSSYGLRSSHSERSEEHTSELQSRQYLVCRLLLEKKNGKTKEDRSLYKKNR